MNSFPPGSDPTFVYFLGYWMLALCVLSPVALFVALNDGRSRVARRLLGALTVASVIGYMPAVVKAAEISFDICQNQCPYADTVMWYLLFCFMC